MLYPLSYFRGWVPVRVVASAIGVEEGLVRAIATAPGAQKDFDFATGAIAWVRARGAQTWPGEVQRELPLRMEEFRRWRADVRAGTPSHGAPNRAPEGCRDSEASDVDERSAEGSQQGENRPEAGAPRPAIRRRSAASRPRWADTEDSEDK